MVLSFLFSLLLALHFHLQLGCSGWISKESQMREETRMGRFMIDQGQVKKIWEQHRHLRESTLLNVLEQIVRVNKAYRMRSLVSWWPTYIPTHSTSSRMVVFQIRSFIPKHKLPK